MKQFMLFNLLERVGARGWRSALESTRRLVGLLSRVLLVVTGGFAKGHCIAIHSMSSSIVQLYKTRGPVGTGQYLKQVSFCLQRYLASPQPSKTVQSGCWIKLTKSGLPSFIPVIYRKRLYNGNVDPTIVRVVLSVCTLHKVMVALPRSGRFTDLRSIIAKGQTYIDARKDIFAEIYESGLEFLHRLYPKIGDIPLHLGYKCIPILSAGPLSLHAALRSTYLDLFGLHGMVQRPTSYHLLGLDTQALLGDGPLSGLMERCRNLFPDNTIYPNHYDEDWSISVDSTGPHPLDIFIEAFRSSNNFSFIGNTPYCSSGNHWCQDLYLGRISRKLEGAGKVRNFAIGNSILQRLLYPLHEWSMSLLSHIEMDGTYNQIAPLNRLRGERVLYSFDLKSATDIFPCEASMMLLESLFDKTVAWSWYEILRSTEFLVPNGIQGDPFHPLSTRFRRGQPLGFFSSWPVFSLTHHWIIVKAAETVYPGKRFTRYAVLGDDVVIADEQVALAYARIMEDIGGVISKEKSLISYVGGCEFAKRFILFNHLESRMDLSPSSLPLIRLLDRYVNPVVFLKLGCSLRAAFRLRHSGYRVYSKVTEMGYQMLGSTWQTLSRRWRRFLVGLLSPSGPQPLPFMLWLQLPSFYTMDVGHMGLLYQLALEKLVPKDLNAESFRSPRLLFYGVGEDLLEVHYGPIVRRYVDHVIWYAKASVFEFSLEQLLKPTIPLSRLVRRDERDLVSKPYGLAYQIWDHYQLIKNVRVYYLTAGIASRDITYSIRVYKYKYSWLQYIDATLGVGT